MHCAFAYYYAMTLFHWHARITYALAFKNLDNKWIYDMGIWQLKTSWQTVRLAGSITLQHVYLQCRGITIISFSHYPVSLRLTRLSPSSLHLSISSISVSQGLVCQLWWFYLDLDWLSLSSLCRTVPGRYFCLQKCRSLFLYWYPPFVSLLDYISHSICIPLFHVACHCIAAFSIRHSFMAFLTRLLMFLCVYN